ncbi:MAG: GntR family transcriptional regulator, partial [Proteobacteria bacterium]|nr:GntR family transcriptional regulator [Pseudomonadota bacterium]
MNKRNQLLHSTINHILEALQSDPSQVPSELGLSKEIEVSRTVIRKAFDLLQKKGVIEKVGRIRTVKRGVQQDDFFILQGDFDEPLDVFQHYFMSQIKRGEIRPGTRFSVLDLSTNSKCNRTVVREFLYSFSKFGLVEKLPRKMWGMVSIDQTYIKELTDIRIDLEVEAVRKLWQHPKTSPIWSKLDSIYQKFLEYQNGIGFPLPAIWKLDEMLFQLLIECNSNRFVSQFHANIYFVYNLLYQWCLEDEDDQLNSRLVQITSFLEK